MKKHYVFMAPLLGSLLIIALALALSGASTEIGLDELMAKYTIGSQTSLSTPAVSLDLTDLEKLKGAMIYQDEAVKITIEQAQLVGERINLFFTFENIIKDVPCYTFVNRYYYSPQGMLETERNVGILEAFVDGEWYPCQWSALSSMGRVQSFGSYLDFRSAPASQYTYAVRKQAESGQIEIRFTNLCRTKWEDPFKIVGDTP